MRLTGAAIGRFYPAPLLRGGSDLDLLVAVWAAWRICTDGATEVAADLTVLRVVVRDALPADPIARN